MGDRGTFTTTLLWHDSRGGEVEADVRILYSFTPGYPDTYEEPGADCEVEIIKITASDPSIDIPEHFYTEETLLDQCVSDWHADQEDVREWLAQCRRDDALMERFGE